MNICPRYLEEFQNIWFWSYTANKRNFTQFLKKRLNKILINYNVQKTNRHTPTQKHIKQIVSYIPKNTARSQLRSFRTIAGHYLFFLHFFYNYRRIYCLFYIPLIERNYVILFSVKFKVVKAYLIYRHIRSHWLFKH